MSRIGKIAYKNVEKEKGIVVAKQEEMNPMMLMEKAMSLNITPETMEKLMNLQDRWETKQAKKAYDVAMSALQKEMPIIAKEKGVKNKDGSSRYRYAPLEQIVKQTSPLIAKHGFSYSVDAQTTMNASEGKVIGLIATVKITHEEGHSQDSSFFAPLDPDAFMSAPQKFGSALTYAKRYAFCNAFGILTADPDTDGNAPSGARGADEKTYNLALKSIGAAKSLTELADFKTSIESGRGKKLYNEDQRGQLLRMIDGKAKEFTGA